MTKFQLFSLLAVHGMAMFTYQGKQYRLKSIEREDGSGSSFNVEAVDLTTHQPCKLYIRTLD